MEKDISKLTNTELESLGYKLYETKEQLAYQMQQVNQNLLIIRGEKEKRNGKTEQPIRKNTESSNANQKKK